MPSLYIWRQGGDGHPRGAQGRSGTWNSGLTIQSSGAGPATHPAAGAHIPPARARAPSPFSRCTASAVVVLLPLVPVMQTHGSGPPPP